MPVHAHIPASHRWMTVEEAAKHFGVVPMRIRVWIMDGNIQVDPRRGVLLADLLRQRDAERQRGAVATPTAPPAPVKPETHVLVKMPDRPVAPPPEPPMIEARAIKAPPMLRASTTDMATIPRNPPDPRTSEPATNSTHLDKVLEIMLKILKWMYYAVRFTWICVCYFSAAIVRFIISFTIGFITVLLFRKIFRK